MIRKLKFFISFMFIVLLFSSCGAKVSTNLIIKEDGGGKRVIYAQISHEDMKKVRGGEESLIKVLNDNKPQNVKLSKISNETGVTLKFEVEFSDKIEYGEKIHSIIGKDHQYEYNYYKDAFRKSFEMYEEDINYDLIKWAVNAVENAGIIKGNSSDFYEIGDTTVETPLGKFTFNGDINIAEKSEHYIENINIITKYNDLGDITRRIEIVFTKTVHDNMNGGELLKYFNNILPGFEVRESEEEVIYMNTIDMVKRNETYEHMNSLTNDTHDFIVKRSEGGNVFVEKNNLKERFSLSNISNNPGTKVRINYLLIYPKEYELSSNSEEEISIKEYDDKYNMIDVKFFNEVSVDLNIDKGIKLKSIDYKIELNGKSDVTKTVNYLFNKGDIKLVEEEIEQFFKKINKDSMKYESRDIIGFRVIEEKKLNNKIDMEYVEDNKELLQVWEGRASNINKEFINVYDCTFIEDFIGSIMPTDRIEYTISIPEDLYVEFGEFNGTEFKDGEFFSFEKDKKEIRFEIDTKDEGYNTLSNITMSLIVSKEKNIITFILFTVLTVIFVGTGAVLLKKKWRMDNV
ncbi:hypothetical protein [Oceanirhabdus sp. W0125-5]|uniref:hypothetical protein n=1 Tax=Oceanirhabdus sp. W0125-5 TaxID=2999116 RepID=UPI0022F33E86|nr:hypothetical protein [Oceanirhabdus sp. W0125-5]WBW98405.1 hypothetical protein OW730_06460 [Oceanirhabdus sp. W0125-5]